MLSPLSWLSTIAYEQNQVSDCMDCMNSCLANGQFGDNLPQVYLQCHIKRSISLMIVKVLTSWTMWTNPNNIG